MYQTDPEKQITAEHLEAVEASLPDVGAVVAEIGMDRPFGEYQKEEALRLIFATVQAFHKHMDEIIARNSPPY